MKIKYWGENRHGITIGGQASVDSVPEFVAGKFEKGWRDLAVTDLGSGEQVGWIRKVDGRRQWSAT